MAGSGDKKFPRTVEKALRILETLAEAGKPLGISEVGARLAISNSTVYRIMGSLMQRGFVTQNDHSSKYALGFKVLELSHALLRRLGIRGIARPLMEKLAHETAETVGLAMLDRGEVVYLDQVDGGEVIRLEFRLGARWPLHATAAGKACLAFMESSQVEEFLEKGRLKSFTEHTTVDPQELRKELVRIRSVGYAFNRGEFERQVRAVGAPLINVDNRPVGSVVLAAPTQRLPESAVPKTGAKVRSLAREISKLLGR
ncbi:MAG: IclR family transcriptional regulator [Proteobacteria bacterium]|nr:IclR family transcriptional regulator [Pseudomonadota bacterium]